MLHRDPLVAGGTLFVGGTEDPVQGPGQILALDAATGRPRWSGLVEFTGDEINPDAYSTASRPLSVSGGAVYASAHPTGLSRWAVPTAG